MNFSYPSLLPFEFASMADRSANTSVRVAGARSDMLKQLFQVRDITLNVAWDVTFSDGLGTVRSRALNVTATSENLNLGPAGGTTSSGFYYKVDGSVLPDPASRLLAFVPPGDYQQGVAFWKLFYTPPAPPGDPYGSMSCNIGFNRTPAGVLRPWMTMSAAGYEGAFATLAADFSPAVAGQFLIASNPVIIDGVNFGPLNLQCGFYPSPVSLISGTFNVTASVTYW